MEWRQKIHYNQEHLFILSPFQRLTMKNIKNLIQIMFKTTKTFQC